MVWYSGGKLAAGFTLPRLRRRWDPPRNTTAHQPGAFRFTGLERDSVFDHAAWRAARAARHIRYCAATDPAAAADAAWATADTLHVAARVLGNPAVCRAADAYDRAARAPYRRIPQQTAAGNELRNAARMLALTADLIVDPSRASVALIARLLSLASGVAELRQASSTPRRQLRRARPPSTCTLRSARRARVPRAS